MLVNDPGNFGKRKFQHSFRGVGVNKLCVRACCMFGFDVYYDVFIETLPFARENVLHKSLLSSNVGKLS